MRVFIPEYDARVLLEGLRQQAQDSDYFDSWRACAHRLADQIELEQAQQADPTDAPELEYLGEVQPGKSYLLRATEPLQPQDGMRAREQLERTFPGSTFAILSHNLEPVEPKPAAELLTVLRDTALKYQGYATKSEPGPSRAAFGIVGNALLDVWHALMTGDGAATPPADSSTTPVATGEEQTDESATGTPPPAAPSPLCHETPHENASGGCVLPAHHADPLHSDAYGNRWSW